MTGTIADVVKQFKRDWTERLSEDSIRAACLQAGHTWRDRVLTPVVTVQLFFVQILHGNTACTHLRHLAGMAVSAAAYCQARMNLPLAVFQILLRQTAAAIGGEELDEGRWLGRHRTFFVDGSSFSMPDTPALQACFGQPGGQRQGCGFPVAHLLLLMHSGTGMLLEILAAPLRTHDMSQVALVHHRLQADDVLVADRGFCSFVHLALLSERRVHAVLRVHQKQIVDFTPRREHAVPTAGKSDRRTGIPRSRWIERLGQEDQIVEWCKPRVCPVWLDEEQFAALPETLRVRELRYRVDRKGFRVKQVTLVTTLLDPAAYTTDALADLYFARWRIETNLAHLKTTMGMDVLKCKSVDGVLKEMIVFALMYNLVRLVMLEAAHRQSVDVERISFIDAARWLDSARDGEALRPLVVNPERPDRYEPRVRKRRPKQYPLMQKPRQELRKSLADKQDTH